MAHGCQSCQRLDPQVSPAPNATNITLDPSWILPWLRSSSKQMPTLAALVLPRRSMFTYSFSSGNPNRSRAALRMRALDWWQMK